MIALAHPAVFWWASGVFAALWITAVIFGLEDYSKGRETLLSALVFVTLFLTVIGAFVGFVYLLVWASVGGS